jgi:hypothetical protein
VGRGCDGFLLDPASEDVASTFRSIETAWQQAGRTHAPRHVTSFWYALGPDSSTQLHAYAARYLAIFGEEFATAMSQACSAHSPAAVRAAISRLEDAGCDELILVPTSADLDELDALTELIS